MIGETPEQKPIPVNAEKKGVIESEEQHTKEFIQMFPEWNNPINKAIFTLAFYKGWKARGENQ